MESSLLGFIIRFCNRESFKHKMKLKSLTANLVHLALFALLCVPEAVLAIDRSDAKDAIFDREGTSLHPAKWHREINPRV